MKSGVYLNIPYETYASWPAVRVSTLNACARSMAHGREAELNPRDDTSALAFGQAIHTALLEPDRFRQEYIVAPSCDRRTKGGRAEWESFIELAAGKTPILAGEFAAAEAMIKSVYGERDCAELLAHGRAREISFVWHDDVTGLLCKGRVDLLTEFAGWTIICDLKSTSNASRYAFQRQMANLGYYRSVAWYRLGLNALVPADRRCVLIAIEKTPPYCAVAYEINDQALAIGEREVRELLVRYASSCESGLWPGYSDGNVVVMDLPAGR